MQGTERAEEKRTPPGPIGVAGSDRDSVLVADLRPTLVIQPGALTLEALQQIHAGTVRLAIDPSAWADVDAAAAVVQAMAAGDAPVYGVNTGFGKLASTRINAADLTRLQLNLIRSHSVGVGEPLSAPVLRLMIAMKAASLARGCSGVRRVVIDTLLAVYNAGILPMVPSQGSVGASGDLAPLSHMTLALIGEGECLVPVAGPVHKAAAQQGADSAKAAESGGMSQNGKSAGLAAGLAAGSGPSYQRWPAAEVLREHGIAPLQLAAKEGLALINGTQTSAALALHGLLSFEPVLEAALVIGATTVDAARGSDSPFDPRIHLLRGQPGQIDVARYYRSLLTGSAIRHSHLDGDDRVQDPYCLRCQPQVTGAALDQLRHAALVLVREANAVTDNPLVFLPGKIGGQAGGAQGDAADASAWQAGWQPSDQPEMLSGGNFHAEPVALAADAMAVAIAEIGAISERRIAMLIDAGVSRLPPFLTADPGLNSGFMIAHVTAAALASENKSLAHPASVDSLPTSANQEDHVSMATFAARRLQPMIANVAHILAIEWLAAAQGIEFLRPLTSSLVIEQAHALLRTRCPSVDVDRYLAPDIAAATALIVNGDAAAVLKALPNVPVLWVPA